MDNTILPYYNTSASATGTVTWMYPQTLTFPAITSTPITEPVPSPELDDLHAQISRVQDELGAIYDCLRAQEERLEALEALPGVREALAAAAK